MAITKIKGPRGWYVEMDTEQIFPDDPGLGTPVMLFGPGKDDHVTWFCAEGTGECSGSGELLPDAVLSWMRKIEPRVDEWMAKHGL